MYTYRIFPEVSLVAVKFLGTVTFQELLNYYTEIGTDEKYSPEMRGVVDLRTAKLQIDSSDIEELAKYGAQNSRARWAILVTDPKTTAFSFLYSGIVEKSHPLVVVDCEEQATDYLGFIVSPFLRILEDLM